MDGFASFMIFGGANGLFATDGKSCFCGVTSLRGAGAKSFRALDDEEILEFQGYDTDKNHDFYMTLMINQKCLKVPT